MLELALLSGLEVGDTRPLPVKAARAEEPVLPEASCAGDVGLPATLAAIFPDGPNSNLTWSDTAEVLAACIGRERVADPEELGRVGDDDRLELQWTVLALGTGAATQEAVPADLGR